MFKNILFTTTDLTKGGGVGRKISMLSKVFNDKGYKNFFLGYHNSDDKYNFFGKYYNLDQNKKFGIFYKIYKLILRSYEIMKISKSNNIKVVFSFGYMGNIPNILSKIIFGNKSKIIIQDTIDIYCFSFLDRLFFHLYKYADKIIVLSGKTKLDLISKYGVNKENIFLFGNPLDLEMVKEKRMEKLDSKYLELFNSGKKTFINIGRYTNQKNQELLIKSFKGLNYNFPNTQLIIIGWGENNEKLKKISKDNKNIHILGFIDNVFTFLDKSDIFVLSSRHEGLPNVILDAMSCGLPIISVDCPTGPKEVLTKKIIINYDNFKEVNDIVVEKYGILVPNFDEGKLQKSMELLLNNEKLKKKLSQKSLERIQDFSIDTISKQYFDILN